MTNQQTLVDYLEGYADEARRLTSSSGSMTLAQIQTALESVTPGGGGGGFDVTGLNGLKFYDLGSTQTSIDVRTLDTSGFTDMSNMFANNTGLTSIPGLNQLDTHNVTNMNCMFQNTRLETMDLSGFNTSNVTNFGQMFRWCSAATSINCQSFTTNSMNVSYGMNMFINGATALTDLIWAINSSTVQKTTSNAFDIANGTVPTNLNIYVRTSLVNSYKSNGSWSRYSSCIKPISELPAALQTLYNIDPNDYQ